MSLIEQNWFLLTPPGTNETRDGRYHSSKTCSPTLSGFKQIDTVGANLRRDHPDLDRIITDDLDEGWFTGTMLYYQIKPEDASLHHYKETTRNTVGRVVPVLKNGEPFKDLIIDPNLTDLTIPDGLRGQEFSPKSDEIARQFWLDQLPLTVERVNRAISAIEELPTTKDKLVIARKPIVLAMAILLRRQGQWDNDLFDCLNNKLELGSLGLVQIKRTFSEVDKKRINKYQLTAWHPGPYDRKNLRWIPEGLFK